MYNAQSLRDKIENEGFDYFFGSYVSSSELPDELREFAENYFNCREDLLLAVNDFLTENDLEELEV